MSYIGAEPTTAAFPFDQFSGNGSTTAFTLTYAPASATSIIVAISGVMQNPNLYSVVGTTLTFSPAPPTGTNNISVLYLGLPVIGSSSPGNTAFLSATDLTATAGQTVFASAGSYTPGFVQVYRNGARLGNADFTATNGTTITLANAATAGDLVTIEYYTLTSLTNALPLTGGTVTGSTTFNSTVTVNGAAVSGFTGMKNRIINGNMVVDQRNAGASVTPTSGAYTLDRFYFSLSQASKLTSQQNAGAVTPPAGFTKYLGVTSSSAYTVGASEIFAVAQQIEGYNIADLAWGTASAATVTLSFWVRSSLTGTFGGAINNDGSSRSYPFSYTISVANTWEQKSITIAGDTSGTWGSTNGTGINLRFGLGVGSTVSGTAGAWSGSTFYSATGATSVVGTSGATFYITGVQLERGSNATSFEFIDYGRQLIQCQRYFYKPTFNEECYIGVCYSTSGVNCPIGFPITMRSAPTVTLATAGQSSTNISFLGVTAGYPAVTGSHTAAAITVNGFRLAGSGYTATGWAGGVGSWLYVTGTSAPFSASAEL